MDKSKPLSQFSGTFNNVLENFDEITLIKKNCVNPDEWKQIYDLTGGVYMLLQPSFIPPILG